MKHDKLRQRIALEAARRMYEHQESFHQAKLKAAHLIVGSWVQSKLLPSHREIRAEIEQLARMHDAMDERLLPAPIETDRFEIYRGLLVPLEHARQSPKTHPEGDVLYHSLQVFDLARQELPYDEEFLLAALLHDVGKGIEPKDHEAAGLEALEDAITPRTYWLIEHLAEAHALLDGTLGMRARRRLGESEHFEELLVLARCDREGRATGVDVPDVDEALAYIRDLAEMCGD